MKRVRFLKMLREFTFFLTNVLGIFFFFLYIFNEESHLFKVNEAFSNLSNISMEL